MTWETQKKYDRYATFAKVAAIICGIFTLAIPAGIGMFGYYYVYLRSGSNPLELGVYYFLIAIWGLIALGYGVATTLSVWMFEFNKKEWWVGAIALIFCGVIPGILYFVTYGLYKHWLFIKECDEEKAAERNAEPEEYEDEEVEEEYEDEEVEEEYEDEEEVDEAEDDGEEPVVVDNTDDKPKPRKKIVFKRTGSTSSNKKKLVYKKRNDNKKSGSSTGKRKLVYKKK